MALTPEQVEEVKNQLRQQVQSMQEPQKSQALQQIQELSQEAVESLVNEQKQQNANQKTIYRMLIDGDVPSIKINSNSHAIALLEINPISKGHTIIIPKKAVTEKEKIPQECFTLAQETAGNINTNLNPNSCEILEESKFGEKIINIIPIYESPLNLNSPRTKATKEELEGLAIKIQQKPIEKIKIDKREEKIPPLKIKRRIP